VEPDVPDWLLSVITALGCFVICGACIVYLKKASQRVRWSRSMQQIVTRHPKPVFFWIKVGVVGSCALLSLGMGVLLIATRGHHFFRPDVAGSKTSLEQLDGAPDR
jgi:hypothetical protein